MTLILEFEHKFIFYKPGILRYAMRRVALQLGAAQHGAERQQLLSQALKRGWDEARAELAALQRLQALTPQERDERRRAPIVIREISSPTEAAQTALAPLRLQ